MLISKQNEFSPISKSTFVLMIIMWKFKLRLIVKGPYFWSSVLAYLSYNNKDFVREIHNKIGAINKEVLFDKDTQDM